MEIDREFDSKADLVEFVLNECGEIRSYVFDCGGPKGNFLCIWGGENTIWNYVLYCISLIKSYFNEDVDTLEIYDVGEIDIDLDKTNIKQLRFSGGGGGVYVKLPKLPESLENLVIDDYQNMYDIQVGIDYSYSDDIKTDYKQPKKKYYVFILKKVTDYFSRELSTPVKQRLGKFNTKKEAIEFLQNYITKITKV